MGFVQRVLSMFEDKRELLDLSCFNDPVALQVSWAPLVRGGTNFCTHRAQLDESLGGSRLVFKTTAAVYGFCILFMAIGVIGLLGSFAVLFGVAGADGSGGLFGVVPCVFLVVGWLLLRWFRSKEAHFEQFSGQFTQGGAVHSLHDVRAIQLIREYVRGDKSSYYSYELNLVRGDASRLNVTDHGSLRVIRADADLLARYLSMPVWDAIDYRIPEAALGVEAKADVVGRNLFG